ncbi:MAG: zinc-ribbon domain-containing protein [Mobilitalea sp.]
MADKVITCKDCKAEFVFTESEQAFYKEKGFDNEPQRCPECRKARKEQKGAQGGNRDNNRGGSRGGQGGQGSQGKRW